MRTSPEPQAIKREWVKSPFPLFHAHTEREGKMSIDQQAIELIKSRRAYRNMVARDLRSLRELRSIPNLSTLTKDDFWRMCSHHKPSPLHSRALEQEAKELIAFSQSPLPGAPGCEGTYIMDDGYSLCGLADAHCEARESARELAPVVLKASKLLGRRYETGNP